jgi:thioredoxin-dependent peroxiredoxin
MKMISLLLIAAGIVVLILVMRPKSASADLLKEGEIAPPFATQMVVGEQVSPVSLADFHGKRVILYFYPKDNTPGCTKEACSFRDGYAKFQQAGLVVLGCSIDTADAHKAFIQKYGLPFPLLLDPDKKIAKEYGAANGIPILGFDRRITYVIGEDGRILKVYPSVDPSVHSGEILSDISKLPPPASAASPAAPAAPPATTPPSN